MNKELENLLDNYENAIYGKVFPITPSMHQLHLLLDYIANLEQQCKKQKEAIDKAIYKLQLLIDIGFDYDGFNQADSLKTLIDESVGYAKESRKILKEIEETDINVGEVE